MTTLQAIATLLTTGKDIKLLAIDAKINLDVEDISLIINGGHSVSFDKSIDKQEGVNIIEEDLRCYTSSFYWLKPIEAPNTGTTVTYKRAWKSANKYLHTNK